MIRIVALGLALAAGDALAHAALIASEPADGAVLERAPASIVLRFSEPVTPVAVRLLDRSGTGAALAAAAEGGTVRAALPAGLPHGAYLVSYRVTSLDSHPIGGAVAFSIGGAERLQVSQRTRRDRRGGALARCASRSPRSGVTARRWRGALCARRAAVPGTAHRAGDRRDGGRCERDDGRRAPRRRAARFQPLGWRVLAHRASPRRAERLRSPWAPVPQRCWPARFAPPAGWPTPCSAPGALISLASFALTGHAAAAEPRAIAATVVLVHVLGAAFWAGSLVGLLAILRRASGPDAATALTRFSGFGVLAVLALMTAGVAFAVLQLESLGQLVESSYGRWIVVKSALLAGLLALAARNRLRLLPALERGEAHAARRLRGTVTAEIVLIAGAIAAAGILAQTPPPRATVVELAQGGYSARLEVSPARAGANAGRDLVPRPRRRRVRPGGGRPRAREPGLRRGADPPHSEPFGAGRVPGRGRRARVRRRLVDLCAAVHAQVWPSKPIRWIVPFPPGGSTDIATRPVADRVGQALGVSSVVENRAGAGGNIGTEAVAKSAPDGYTVLVTADALAANPQLYKLAWDPFRDFVPGDPARAPAGRPRRASVARRDQRRGARRAGEAGARARLRDLRRRLAAAHGGGVVRLDRRASSSRTCRTRAAARRSPTSSAGR